MSDTGATSQARSSSFSAGTLEFKTNFEKYCDYWNGVIFYNFFAEIQVCKKKKKRKKPTFK